MTCRVPYPSEPFLGAIGLSSMDPADSDRPADNYEVEGSAADPSGGSRAQDELHEHFTAILARHHMSLMSYLLSMIPSWSDAEDVLQQTSVVMWRKFGEFKLGSDFLSWGCQIARYQALNFLRKRTRDRHVFSLDLLETLASEGARDIEQQEAERNALRACLKKLPEDQQNLLASCYSPGVTVQQMAKTLGRTPNSVYKGLNRIREALLRCIRKALAMEGG